MAEPSEEPLDVKKRRATHYNIRTARFWGTFRTPGKGGQGRQRARTEGDVNADEVPERRAWNLGDPLVRELFPVPEHEVLEGGDVLVLSLPEEKCMALADDYRRSIAQSDSSQQAAAGAAPDASPRRSGTKADPGPLTVRGADLLELPGYQNEYVELVVSHSSPFLGKELTGPRRRKFEKTYQVAILAVRHAMGEDSPDERGRLHAGDTVLVLAQAGDACERLATSRDFMALTRVGHRQEFVAKLTDYLPLVLFTAGLVLVAMNVVSMLRVSMLLAVIYLLAGWVNPTEMRECVDWNVLVLVGCSLGMAEAVKASGLSSKAAAMVTSAGTSPRGSVFILFFVVMLVSEVVSSQAAAAVGFPVALDLSEQLQLTSLKPLAMTVMLAAATSYANPISSPCHLVVMGPGGYSFGDFLRVGLPMDLIYWVLCCALLPSIWPLE